MRITQLFLIIFISVIITKSHASQTDFDKAMSNKNIKAAEILYQNLTDEELTSVAGKVMQSRLLMAKGESEEAYDLLEAVRENHKNNVDLEYYFGLTAADMAQKASIFSKLGYAEDVLEAWEKVVELDPKHVAGLNHLIGFHLAAPGIAGGDKDKALILAKQLQKIDLENGAQQLANVYWQTEEPALADKTIAQALIELPESSSLYFTKASAFMRAKKWQKAHDDFAQAIKYAKTAEQKSHALYQQGKLSVESGLEVDAGIAALTEVSSMESTKYKNWLEFRLAQLYLHNKDLKQAKILIAQVNTDEDKELKKRVKKFKKKMKKLKS